MNLRVVTHTSRPSAAAPGAPTGTPSTEIDPLSAFVPEIGGLPQPGQSAQPTAPRSAAIPSLWRAALVIATGVAVVAVIAFGIQFQGRSPVQPEVRTGRLVLETEPPGADVLVDGQPQGTTPVALNLNIGQHSVTLRRDAETRGFSVNITAGTETVHHWEFAPLSMPAQASEGLATLGSLTVATDPPGARISIDGQPHGTSPATVRDLSLGPHRVSVVGPAGSAERAVTVEAGLTATVVFSLNRALTQGVTAGWLVVQSPFDVQVALAGDIVGTSAASKIMLPAGRHDLTFANGELGFEELRRIEIKPGETISIPLDARANLNVNARPWADVLIDGAPVGQTPIANHAVALGRHQIVFRHPELGERRQAIVVTAKGPNRVAVDLTR